ncbi:MAG: aa3-type cytochrome c oxidase subunit IV [Alphaproteobacteria bacterium]
MDKSKSHENFYARFIKLTIWSCVIVVILLVVLWFFLIK